MQSTKDRMVVRVGGWIAVYHSGAYIDVYHASHPDDALDVINVWDYAADKATIPFERSAVRAELREWIADCADDYIRNALPYL